MKQDNPSLERLFQAELEFLQHARYMTTTRQRRLDFLRAVLSPEQVAKLNKAEANMRHRITHTAIRFYFPDAGEGPSDSEAAPVMAFAGCKFTLSDLAGYLSAIYPDHCRDIDHRTEVMVSTDGGETWARWVWESEATVVHSLRKVQ